MKIEEKEFKKQHKIPLTAKNKTFRKDGQRSVYRVTTTTGSTFFAHTHLKDGRWRVGLCNGMDNYISGSLYDAIVCTKTLGWGYWAGETAIQKIEYGKFFIESNDDCQEHFISEGEKELIPSGIRSEIIGPFVKFNHSFLTPGCFKGSFFEVRYENNQTILMSVVDCSAVYKKKTFVGGDTTDIAQGYCSNIEDLLKGCPDQHLPPVKHLMEVSLYWNSQTQKVEVEEKNAKR